VRCFPYRQSSTGLQRSAASFDEKETLLSSRYCAGTLNSSPDSRESMATHPSLWIRWKNIYHYAVSGWAALEDLRVACVRPAMWGHYVAAQAPPRSSMIPCCFKGARTRETTCSTQGVLLQSRPIGTVLLCSLLFRGSGASREAVVPASLLEEVELQNGIPTAGPRHRTG
jgi:hypothetical protein